MYAAALAPAHAHEQGADQPGSGRHSDAVEVTQPAPGVVERTGDHVVDDLKVSARGELGHDPAIHRVYVLRQDDVATKIHGAVEDGSRGLVAAGFEPEHQRAAHSNPTPSAACSAATRRTVTESACGVPKVKSGTPSRCTGRRSCPPGGRSRNSSSATTNRSCAGSTRSTTERAPMRVTGIVSGRNSKPLNAREAPVTGTPTTRSTELSTSTETETVSGAKRRSARAERSTPDARRARLLHFGKVDGLEHDRRKIAQPARRADHTDGGGVDGQRGREREPWRELPHVGGDDRDGDRRHALEGEDNHSRLDFLDDHVLDALESDPVPVDRQRGVRRGHGVHGDDDGGSVSPEPQELTCRPSESNHRAGRDRLTHQGPLRVVHLHTDRGRRRTRDARASPSGQPPRATGRARRRRALGSSSWRARWGGSASSSVQKPTDQLEISGRVPFRGPGDLLVDHSVLAD